MDFANNLINRRKKAGLTQEKVADELGITRQAISKWESGTSLPDAEMIIKLCAVLDVTPNQLLGDTAADQPLPHREKNPNLTFIMSSVFLMVIFLGNLALFISYTFNTNDVSSVVAFAALAGMAGSLLAYCILAFCFRKKQKKKSEAR